MADVVLEKIEKRFGDVRTVAGIDLTVRDQEFLILVGPSGCGKTTALRMVAGLEDVTAGTIRLDGKLAMALLEHGAPVNARQQQGASRIKRYACMSEVRYVGHAQEVVGSRTIHVDVDVLVDRGRDEEAGVLGVIARQVGPAAAERRARGRRQK